jgi:hypothetical protein
LADVVEFAIAHGFRWPVDREGREAEALSDREARELAEAVARGLAEDSDDVAAAKASTLLTERLVVTPATPMFPDEPIQIPARTIAYWRELITYARRCGFDVSI